MSQPSEPRDVRMRGFATRSTVEEATAWVDAASTGLEPQDVELNQAGGRVLATTVVAPISVPPFERSAMDGYAVVADETTGASDYSPLPFEVVGASMPGKPFAGEVGSCLLYTSPSPRDQRGSRMPSSA